MPDTVITALGFGKIRTITKTADETVTSSTVLQADNHFTFPVVASRRYYAEFTLFFTFGNTTNGGLHLNPAGPTVGSDAWWAVHHIRDDGAGNQEMDTWQATGYLTAIIDLLAFVRLRTVFNTTNNTSFRLDWAQNSSSAVGTIMRSGSFATIQDLGPG